MWFYEKDGNPTGPFADRDMRDLINKAVIQGQTRVWTEGMDDWAPLNTTLLWDDKNSGEEGIRKPRLKLSQVSSSVPLMKEAEPPAEDMSAKEEPSPQSEQAGRKKLSLRGSISASSQPEAKARPEPLMREDSVAEKPKPALKPLSETNPARPKRKLLQKSSEALQKPAAKPLISEPEPSPDAIEPPIDSTPDEPSIGQAGVEPTEEPTAGMMPAPPPRPGSEAPKMDAGDLDWGDDDPDWGADLVEPPVGESEPAETEPKEPEIHPKAKKSTGLGFGGALSRAAKSAEPPAEESAVSPISFPDEDDDFFKDEPADKSMEPGLPTEPETIAPDEEEATYSSSAQQPARKLAFKSRQVYRGQGHGREVPEEETPTNESSFDWKDPKGLTTMLRLGLRGLMLVTFLGTLGLYETSRLVGQIETGYYQNLAQIDRLLAEDQTRSLALVGMGVLLTLISFVMVLKWTSRLLANAQALNLKLDGLNASKLMHYLILAPFFPGCGADVLTRLWKAYSVKNTTPPPALALWGLLLPASVVSTLALIIVRWMIGGDVPASWLIYLQMAANLMALGGIALTLEIIRGMTEQHNLASKNCGHL